MCERRGERERETEALLSHHISRVYGVRGKEGQQTCRAESDGGTSEQREGGREGLVVRGPRKRRTRRGGKLRGDSWFTCRHGNAASPLTCYSIGIARPSAAVLSQPPQKYEHESRSIAWDRERADASFPMGERSLACWRRDLSASPRIDGDPLSFFPNGHGRKRRKSVARACERHGITLSRVPPL